MIEDFRILYTDRFGPVKFTNENMEGFIVDTIHCPKCKAGLLDGMWYSKEPRLYVSFECLSCHATYNETGDVFENVTK